MRGSFTDLQQCNLSKSDHKVIGIMFVSKPVIVTYTDIVAMHACITSNSPTAPMKDKCPPFITILGCHHW